MRGLHLSDVHLLPEDQLSPSSEPQPTSSSPSTARHVPEVRRRKTKIDHTKVIEARVEDGRLEPSRKCSPRISYYFTQRNDLEGVNWESVMKSTKGFYWGEYLRYTTHVGFDTQTVYKVWTTNVSKRYAD